MAEEKSLSAMGITALVLGIIGLVISWMPIINNFAFVLGILGIIFALIGLKATGKKGTKRGRGLVIAGLVLAIVTMGVTLATQAAYSAALNKGAEAAQKAADDITADKRDQFPIEGQKTETTPYSYKVTGTITNKSGKDVNTVSLEYRVLDASGTQLGSAYATTTNLKADGTWAFEASYMGSNADKVAKVELVKINAY